MLEMLHISKLFPGVRALDDVTLQAKSGRVLALVGINGAGKSTLMNVLGGVLKCDEGEIRIDGKGITLNDPKDAERNGIAFIHQEPLFFASMTVAQNIYITRMFSGKVPGIVDDARAIREARKTLAILGSDDIDPRSKMEDITIGARQMVEIARALALGAEIIIFDEPTSSLSIHEKESLFKVIRKLRDDGKIIIYISHFLDEIAELCDDYLVLRDGKMSGRGLVGDLKKDDLVTMIIGQRLERVEKKRTEAKDRPAVLKVEDIRSGNLLRGVNLELRQGEVLGLWGLMGSGRTELVRAMFGLDRVDGGSVYCLEDGEWKPIKRNVLLRRCGYVTESRHTDGLFLEMDITRNCSAASLERYSVGIGSFIDAKREDADATKLMEMLNIKAPNPHTVVGQLSGGNQQKVIFAKWMNKGANILVLDEPTRGVDVGAKLEIYRIIRRLAVEGTSVLLISSETDEMVDLSDRVAVLQGGRVVTYAEGADINSSHLMALALGEGGGGL